MPSAVEVERQVAVESPVEGEGEIAKSRAARNSSARRSSL
jgi:hypothetical protein